jgi:uncharacterized protein YjbI with pentapeptide repeats
MNHSFKNFLSKNWVLLSCIGFALLVVGMIQQHNVNILGEKIDRLNCEILGGEIKESNCTSKLPKPAELEILKLKKDILVIEKDKTIILNGIGATIAQALGAFVLGATAYVGYQNFKMGLDNLRINEENLRVSEEKQVTERFSKAIEHLGNTETEIRLGGIYALEQIAKYSPKQYHWTIVEILSAFVREKCPIIYSEAQSDPSNQTLAEKIQADVQAALTVISRRESAQDPRGKRIDLRKINASQIELRESILNCANLSGANLSGADLRNAHLCGADLSDADLTGAYLRDADLTGADLSLAKLNDAHLSGANLNRAHLSRADFRGADLSFVDFLYTPLVQVDFRGVDLRGCKNLDPVQIHLAHTDENTEWPGYLNPPKDCLINIFRKIF